MGGREDRGLARLGPGGAGGRVLVPTGGPGAGGQWGLEQEEVARFREAARAGRGRAGQASPGGGPPREERGATPWVIHGIDTPHPQPSLRWRVHGPLQSGDTQALISGSWTHSQPPWGPQAPATAWASRTPPDHPQGMATRGISPLPHGPERRVHDLQLGDPRSTGHPLRAHAGHARLRATVSAWQAGAQCAWAGIWAAATTSCQCWLLCNGSLPPASLWVIFHKFSQSGLTRPRRWAVIGLFYK